MPSLFSKHLHLCFFKHKYPTILCHSHSPPPSPPSTTDHYFSSSSSSSDSTEPDFASIFASQRFFFSSPGTSNSIIQSPDTRTSTPTGGGITVPKYSLNPYVDFLRSMQEMIRSRQIFDVRKDWDYLHELLLCYLALNPTHTHKYIVRAFTDLVVELLSSTPRRTRNNRRQSSFSGSFV
ncbi:transcription repressor OFP12-like [Abrus precatorius]|uniref:Transcription repressor n=1 Tax=Abrus precatorius TaxID=3816 RepID=A0A8B8M7T3_ABRPR|nr:transcription repressor OFP12-like [Abrus precatorius]